MPRPIYVTLQHFQVHPGETEGLRSFPNVFRMFSEQDALLGLAEIVFEIPVIGV